MRARRGLVRARALVMVLAASSATATSVVDVALLCDVGTANREECDAARAAVDAAAAAHAWAAALFPGGGDDALDAAMRDFVVESR